MAAPVVIDPTQQKETGDCVIASLAMLLGVPYSAVSAKALEFWPKSNKSGLTVREAQRVIHALAGRYFESVDARKTDLDDETGILFVKLPGDYHAVALFEGVIYNPADGLLWNRSAYCATKKAQLQRLLRP